MSDWATVGTLRLGPGSRVQGLDEATVQGCGQSPAMPGRGPRAAGYRAVQLRATGYRQGRVPEPVSGCQLVQAGCYTQVRGRARKPHVTHRQVPIPVPVPHSRSLMKKVAGRAPGPKSPALNVRLWEQASGFLIQAKRYRTQRDWTNAWTLFTETLLLFNALWKVFPGHGARIHRYMIWILGSWTGKMTCMLPQPLGTYPRTLVAEGPWYLGTGNMLLCRMS